MKHIIMKVLVVSIFFLTQMSLLNADSITEWEADIAKIVNDITLYHHNPFNKVGKLTFLRAAKALKDDLPHLSEEQRVVRVMQLVALIGDGHTLVEPDNPDFAYWYPIRMVEFSDGYFVTAAHKSVKELAGAEVLSIAEKPINVVAKDARSLFGAENYFDQKQRLYAIHNASLMKGLGYAKINKDIDIRFKLKSGKVVNRTLKPSRGTHPRWGENYSGFDWRFTSEMYGLFDPYEDWYSAYNDLPASAFLEEDLSRPPFLTQRFSYASRAIPDKDAYYMQYHWISDTDFVPYLRNALAEVDKIKPKRLIIDFRFCFGGDASKGSEIIAEFIKRQDSPPWENLYIIYGPKTYSAAVLVADLFRKYVLITTVGEPFGSSYNMSGDPLNWYYPNTGLQLHISTLFYQQSSYDDIREYIPVNYPAPLSFADYVVGKDTALDAIFSEEDIRSIPLIALEKGGNAAREVYLKRKNKFQHLFWWMPPTEIELRIIGDRLQEQNRLEEALEVCMLNTEIHPNIWNVWYNLAGIQNKIKGLEEKRLSSYQCVVELAPGNWNVPAIKELFERLGVNPELPEGCPVKK